MSCKQCGYCNFWFVPAASHAHGRVFYVGVIFRLNLGMSLDDFKRIYYMEYAHRMMGRLIGAVYVAPLAYFLWTRKIRPLPSKFMSSGRRNTLLAIGGLILFQVALLRGKDIFASFI